MPPKVLDTSVNKMNKSSELLDLMFTTGKFVEEIIANLSTFTMYQNATKKKNKAITPDHTLKPLRKVE